MAISKHVKEINWFPSRTSYKLQSEKSKGLWQAGKALNRPREERWEGKE
jgi:uncharacterized cysteine cluster protein YcgN (CxxCxxCC family)